ncbi:bidirectional sugar transporter N3-like [Olea europaea subsp. europaea]|uniref:Bidirectional sugar transporter SWEET n=2 Tax=Olea europaea subsp. europaea TaxID=158383 RepID=A0A8S0SGN6_OLEEU|nr:bidirectional sugar transporter N3-like [Olea europaea subsp. europaea]
MPIFDLHHPWVFAFGVLGNIVSVLVYLAPLPTFIRIYREKSTMGFQSLPYVVALFAAMLWLLYSFLKTNAFLLVSINSFGCIIEAIYIFFYLLYASKKARIHTVKLLASLNIGLFSLIFLLALFVFNQHRVGIVGWICVAVSVCVFAAPLSIVFKVVRTRSVEFMPFGLSFFLTVSAITWFAYGLFLKDICITLPNVIGFFLGLLQMLLYGLFRNAKPVMEEKNLPEHVINIMMLGFDFQKCASKNETSQDEDKKDVEEDDNMETCVPCELNVEPCTQVNLDTPILVICTP